MLDTQNVSIRSASVGSMDNNVYVLTAKNSGDQVLIDAADDFARIQEVLDAGAGDLYGGVSQASVRMIITTHSHWDHVRALAEAAEATGARTAAGSEDIADIPVPTDVPLKHGDVLDFDGFDLEVIGLRGHTPGSVALLFRDPDGPAHLFTGDSLFPGGVGNTQKDPARFSSLINDVIERIFEYLPDDTIVHPGHGAGTTLGAERPHLAEWKERGW
ncbi:MULTISPECIES: MBL fold metallo-hydrolase [Arthrobacter]|uniref:MBL fold metallo-hydrolase n=1 Tax=Arthrobacter caoxuetaonis TaxID=2886935 RepID=A0A9X1MF30_9MICC|nr:MULTISPECIES: MBL fold metallo-hydrolase [Arthrobacter]MCC3283469.1 MBL fold metallo-hydrolase [Arthrobacter caoxuetaonis]MCC3298868.1 MBL fold metallo-hydrolase [Arthrobacter caoxuetaonis]MCC9193428.1 MBL fold metallo-hydrolase [Arthrobacter sp. zg-Y916]USQ55785.1 MBL fold metallo-hydrolase [Arthrobacter caoxuetaonis]